MQHIIEMDGEMIMFVNGDIFKAVNAWTGDPIVRTKQSHPYSYEPFTVWGKKVENGNGVYSDRLYQWDYAKYNKCCEEIWGNQGQYFDNRSPQSIENFLKLYLGKDNINLTWIVEDCNSSNGYPVWYFQYEEADNG